MSARCSRRHTACSGSKQRAVRRDHFYAALVVASTMCRLTHPHRPETVYPHKDDDVISRHESHSVCGGTLTGARVRMPDTNQRHLRTAHSRTDRMRQ